MRYAIAGIVVGFGFVGIAACMLSSRISERDRVSVIPDPPGGWVVQNNKRGRDMMNRLRDAGL